MKREMLVYTVMFVSLLAAAISIGVAHSSPGPAPRAAGESGPLPVGVQMLGEENNDTPVIRAEQAGANWARIILLWSSIESTPGNYNWSSSFDEALSRLATHGLTPIVEVRSSPAWAHEETGQDCGPIDGPITDPFEPPTPGPPIPSPGPFRTYLPLVMKSWPPTDLDRFQYFVSALVERYDGDGGAEDAPGSPQVKYWEFWNEPDNKSLSSSCIFVGGCWGGDLDNDGIPDPEEYVAMLERAYTAVKASDPEAQVVMGSIALESISEDCFNLSFLDQVLANGGGPYFDLMGFHYYNFKRDVWDGTLPYQQGVIGKATYIKDKLASYGLTKPLICSEFGLTSDRTEVKNDLQARYLVHEFVRGMSMWPVDMKAVIWYTLGEYCQVYGCYGLLDWPDTGYAPHPAHDAYRVMTSQLQGASFEHQLGPSETGHKYIQAYRFIKGSDRMLVLWTDTGERISDQPDHHRDMIIGPDQLNEAWTGQLRVVDLYGNVTTVSDGGAGFITLQISQSPIYVSTTP